jgi:hypothetical protein
MRFREGANGFLTQTDGLHQGVLKALAASHVNHAA